MGILHRKVGQSTSQKMKVAILLLTVRALVLATGDPVVPEPELTEPPKDSSLVEEEDVPKVAEDYLMNPFWPKSQRCPRPCLWEWCSEMGCPRAYPYGGGGGGRGGGQNNRIDYSHTRKFPYQYGGGGGGNRFFPDLCMRLCVRLPGCPEAILYGGGADGGGGGGQNNRLYLPYQYGGGGGEGANRFFPPNTCVRGCLKICGT